VNTFFKILFAFAQLGRKWVPKMRMLYFKIILACVQRISYFVHVKNKEKEQQEMSPVISKYTGVKKSPTFMMKQYFRKSLP
jgi:hypothetical protein